MSIPELDEVDALVRRADPFYEASVPPVDSEEAHRIWAQVERGVVVGPARRRRVAAPVLVAGGVAAAVLAVVLIVLQLLPVSPVPGPESAAAALEGLARTASAQPPTRLETGQWLFRRYRATITLDSSGRFHLSTGTPTWTATGGVKGWANADGNTCALGHWTSPSRAAHLPSGWVCTSVGGPGSLGPGGAGLGAIDVVGLPTRAPTLARELETGTTGISALDQDVFGPGAGLVRAAALLVGPTVGATPRFWATLLDAVSVMPGVTNLGSRTTHSGETGTGFGARTAYGQTEIILSPGTGTLLEARDIPLPGALAVSAGPSVALTARVLWVDPSGVPSVVGVVPVPSGMDVRPTRFVVTGTLPAGPAGPARTEAQRTIEKLGLSKLPQVSGQSIVGSSYIVDVAGSHAEAAAVERTMQRPGLFSSVAIRSNAARFRQNKP